MSKVENGVLVTTCWLLAWLRHQRFFSLNELNWSLRMLLSSPDAEWKAARVDVDYHVEVARVRSSGIVTVDSNSHGIALLMDVNLGTRTNEQGYASQRHQHALNLDLHGRVTQPQPVLCFDEPVTTVLRPTVVVIVNREPARGLPPPDVCPYLLAPRRKGKFEFIH